MAEKSTTRDYLDWYRALTRHRMQQGTGVDPEAAMDRAFARAAKAMERLRQEWVRQQAAEPVPRDYLDLQRFVPEDGAAQTPSWITPERAAFDQAFEQEFALAAARARARLWERWRQSQGRTPPVPSLVDEADEA